MTTRSTILGLALVAFLAAGCGEEPKKGSSDPLPPHNFDKKEMPKDEGIPMLITVARTHSNPAVRKQAMFWLGQSKDPRALEFFAEILK